jgi:hypothetical protein
MSAISKSEVTRIGQRLLAGENAASNDLRVFRRLRAASLRDGCVLLQDVCSDTEADLSGRLKREYAIKRKLLRTPSMQLSRMTDVVGFRAIVADSAAQRAVTERLQALACYRDIRDYAAAPQPSGYRGVHIFLSLPSGEDMLPGSYPAEVQIRTLAQHLWASVSESFGEATKEGRGREDVRRWLKALSEAIRSFDDNPDVFDFERPQLGVGQPTFNVLCFDQTKKTLTGVQDCGGDIALAQQHQELLETSPVFANRYEVVLLVSGAGSKPTLSHVRYFHPEGRPTVPAEILADVGPADFSDSDLWTPEVGRIEAA